MVVCSSCKNASGDAIEVEEAIASVPENGGGQVFDVVKHSHSLIILEDKY